MVSEDRAGSTGVSGSVERNENRFRLRADQIREDVEGVVGAADDEPLIG